MRAGLLIALAASVLSFPALAQEGKQVPRSPEDAPAVLETEEPQQAPEAHGGTSEGIEHGDPQMGAPKEDGPHPGHDHAVHHPEKQKWSFKGPFASYDRAAVQRGFEVYRQVCASCHSMGRLYYRDLMALGYTEDQVKAIAADYTVTDGPNDEGEMFERPARPSDRFKDPFANRQAAMFANNGAYPPDMSLLSKARHGGPDYIYGILTGYGPPEPGREILPGQHWNNIMPGNIIAMAPPLADGMVSYEDGTEGTLDQYARDVSQFLAWASEPHMEVRKRTGVRAFLFLLVFTLIMYGVKKKVWQDIHH